jgi:eukaryotic-like serine/threonine-protein kinase
LSDLLPRLSAALADRYRIERELGRGGMATVFLAQDLKHDRRVAIKVLDPEVAAAIGQERFLREIATVARLTHPHVLPLHDSGQADGLLFYVMPYVTGESLRQRLQREKQLPVEDALRLAREVADALDYAHRQGVVHRDIKPENILLEEQHALVADFGIARALVAAGGETLTRTGVAVGTPTYMSPEQVAGGPVDARSDLYGLGCVLYEMLSGETPFTGPTAESVLFQHLNSPPPPVTQLRPSLSPVVNQVVARVLAKTPADRFATGQQFADALVRAEVPPPSGHGSAWRLSKRGSLVTAVAVVAVAVVVAGFVQRARSRRWAQQQLLPQIERAADQENYFGAFGLANRARRALGRDASLARLWPSFSIVVSLTTHPDRARVYRRPYSGADSTWEFVGISPLRGVRFARDAYRLRIEKDGFQSIEDMRLFRFGGTYVADSSNIRYLLDPIGRVPPGMVHILPVGPEGAFATLESRVGQGLDDYWLDRFEVTNQQFAAFVDSGGYRRPELWKNAFVRDGHPIPWKEAMESFKDQTGRPGPATWEAARFPEGQGAYPVRGVSWYEAAAFAEFVGKALPPIAYWQRAAGIACSDYIVPASNFSQRAPTPVGAFPAISPFGLRDMAGNVKEWCWNEDGDGNRYVLGGAWDEPSYMFSEVDARSPWDRSSDIGFRCTKCSGGGEAPQSVLAPVSTPRRDFGHEIPVPASVFAAYESFYSYDRTPLRASVTAADSSSEFWIRETVSFDAAYGGERITAYVFVPRHGHPPYQAVLYFPGSNALLLRSSGELETARFDFVVKSGRAVIYPVYKSTYERGDGFTSDDADTSIRYRDHVLMWVKDARRTIDYLETRSDIDSRRIGFLGFSWGAYVGPVILAVERRIAASVLVAGGFEALRCRPEVEPLNFCPRVKQPILMLNGRYDYFFPVGTSQETMFRLLGTPASQKRHALFQAGHSVPRLDVMREVVAWLDRYLGPLK